jgi:hypothetical protein
MTVYILSNATCSFLNTNSYKSEYNFRFFFQIKFLQQQNEELLNRCQTQQNQISEKTPHPNPSAPTMWARFLHSVYLLVRLLYFSKYCSRYGLMLIGLLKDFKSRYFISVLIIVSVFMGIKNYCMNVFMVVKQQYRIWTPHDLPTSSVNWFLYKYTWK